MDFELTDDQTMLVDMAKRMSNDSIQPILDREPTDKPLNRAAMLEIYTHLAEFGVTSARLAESDGGSGLSLLDYGLIMEQLPPVVALSLLSHDGSTVRFNAGADEALRSEYLDEFIAGRKIVCTANSEPNAGSDSNAVSTRLEVDGEKAFITGKKMWITNASICDCMIVSCSTGKDDRGRPIPQRVMVDLSKSDVGLSETALNGLKQGHLCEVTFDRTEVPLKNIIGEPGDAGKYMTIVWNANRPLIGLMALSIAQRAYDMALEHANDRHQFGSSLASRQLIQQDLSDMQAKLISSRLTCLMALASLDKGARSNGLSAMAKRLATEAAVEIINSAMHICGGMGISEELGLAQLWADARVFQVPDGTQGILALIHGRDLTGQAAWR
ncbi:acyl-CoA dehydrogenase family protein [Notoacmeibacter sp. MSK16QG-6]|uniref:acyl-CoA dehydrogenase family protein n=1 Tax=Notoacmeibacter sp. MSK16QG-6 TaxID=2957982 RepID=UPI00209D8F65|nr:acyl-CoA dehydrogenase family protein [Notoacmeibacter sp. MSK16QG-6]MCP1198344.1 acyl-CoA/acyl-ACP dehydrogenase [Notoacmeibacter sp. MSK16QG-6]